MVDLSRQKKLHKYYVECLRIQHNGKSFTSTSCDIIYCITKPCGCKEQHRIEVKMSLAKLSSCQILRISAETVKLASYLASLTICFFISDERYDIPFVDVVNMMQRVKPSKTENVTSWKAPLPKNLLKSYLVERPIVAFW
jgi:hypothetical protein